MSRRGGVGVEIPLLPPLLLFSFLLAPSVMPRWGASPFVCAVCNHFCSLKPLPQTSLSLWSPSPTPTGLPTLLERVAVLGAAMCVSSPGLEPREARAPLTSSLLSDEHREEAFFVAQIGE